MAEAKLYRITIRGSKRKYCVAAFSAQEACEKLGLLIGDCHVREVCEGIWRYE